MNNRSEFFSGGMAGIRQSMSDRAAIKATLKAAIEAADRLEVSVRHSEKMGALPPSLMSGRRDLYDARRLLASGISRLKEHCS
ncbi:MAG: hypothetical protein ABJX32_04615 [Tateyamaria sp.]|uniref:hypothetical protein n=1 Tax=Tateyamaria sp. TaxID=1929288 RepID=UPI00329E7937